MASNALTLPRLAIVAFSFGGALLGLGCLLLAGEQGTRAAWGLDVGPWGANFVVLGATAGASAFWLSWQHMAARIGLTIAGLLVALGVILWTAANYIEPLLTQFVAVVALVSGVRGAAYHLGGLLPRIRHGGAMPLGEKAAMFSLVANACIVAFLLNKSGELGDTSAYLGSQLGILTATALMVVGILVGESLVLRFLRGDENAETLEDECDTGIKTEAARVAHVLLVTMLVILVMQLGLGSALDRELLGLSTSLGTAHVLLALLFLSQCGKSIAEIWSYRRARN